MEATTAPPCRLSVVVAGVDARETIDECLAALRLACGGIASEILVVHPADAALAARVREGQGDVIVVDGGAAALVPHLWGQGFRRSRGEVVAFSTGHCIVGPTWAQSLLAVIDGGATGAGGALDLAPRVGMVAAAVYFLRYSAFMPPAPTGPVAEIPGDNAAYRRSALDRHAASFADGFWEVDFHRRIRPEGGTLVFAAGATAMVRATYRFGTIARHRFRHGSHYGGYRVLSNGDPVWRVILAAPLLPFVLALRVLRRAGGRALSCLPALLALGAAWAAGESWGAFHSAGPRAPLVAA